ncbi:acyltransferase [Actinoplanes sp. NPDC049118]|uniref:acyltransferase family protein n=1 Tax=Actinoplanes sp. NPDC049118 TaxID=3155769 RepID=UPI0033F4AECA
MTTPGEDQQTKSNPPTRTVRPNLPGPRGGSPGAGAPVVPALQRRPRLPALDGLRLICALAVAGYHYGVSWRLDGIHPPAHFVPHAGHVLIYGFLGVEVFFLISGFVICMSGWGRSPRDFLASRAGRLYPAFWACVLLTAAVVTVLPVTLGVPVSGQPSVTDVAVNLTMLPDLLNVPMVDTVYWTLWVELRFYLFFACLTWTGLTYRRTATFCTAWLVAAVVVPAHSQSLLTDIVMPQWAPYFIAGVTMYLMHRHRPTAWLCALVVACWLLSLQSVHVRVLDVHPGFPVPTWPAPVIITIAYVVLIAIALGATDRLTWRWLTTAGALTYPFYLLHQRIGYSIIRNVHAHTGWPAAPLILGAVVLLLGVSWLVHRFVERPLMPALGSLLRGRRARAA